MPNSFATWPRQSTIPVLNNGGSYDIGRVIIEACEELRSPPECRH